MKSKLVLMFAIIFMLFVGWSAQTVPLYSISIKQAGDTIANGSLVVSFPDTASRNEVIDRIAAARGYQDTIDGQPNPETKQQFALRSLKAFLNDTLRSSIRAGYHATADGNAATDEAAKLPN